MATERVEMGDASSRSMAGLYLHVPFCSAVCPYCDFAVQTGASTLHARYTDALCAEIGLWRGWSTPIDTLYFGGGTPSLLPADQLARILDIASAHLPLSADLQIYFEANPEDVTPASLADWKQLGVRFLSLGIQSFTDGELKRLGRRHSGAEAMIAVERALSAGFTTVSVDLMFGLPDHTRAEWEATLSTVADLGPQHVSCYQLTVHEGTTFYRWRERGKLVELDEDRQASLFEITHDYLGEHGYDAYEVSNFARSARHQSAHNRKYWSHAPYLGLGPSAHSFDGTRRWWNHTRLEEYFESVAGGHRPISDEERLGPEALALEALMLGLRTTEGIGYDAFANRYGVDLSGLNRRLLSDLIASSLAFDDSEHIRLTRRGLAVADGLAAKFRLAG